MRRHKDYLDSTVLATASDGQVASPTGTTGRLEYGPYGEVIAADAGTATVRQRFNGKELDETGLADYGARYVNHALGRWLSRDPVALMDPTLAGQSANLYAFSNNNPVRFIDPKGLSAEESKKEKQAPPPPPEPKVLTRGESVKSSDGKTETTMTCSSTCPNATLDSGGSSSTTAAAPAPSGAPAAGGGGSPPPAKDTTDVGPPQKTPGPTGQELLQKPYVQVLLKTAFEKGNPGNEKKAHEEGGWGYLYTQTNTIVHRWAKPGPTGTGPRGFFENRPLQPAHRPRRGADIQVWAKRSTSATTQAAPGKTVPHCLNARLVVMTVERCSWRRLTML